MLTPTFRTGAIIEAYIDSLPNAKIGNSSDQSLNQEKMGEPSTTRLAHELTRGEEGCAGYGTSQGSPIFSNRLNPDISRPLNPVD
ncbi:hypothetical protein ACE1AT_04630 [Pelatocladus sp. BLCC-F211]|uniref:hypothetical protein n=1 Tax=Pelatocladus sp. BLCC-F211 TaxID=3342752 RepID=UPI0035BA467C